MTRQAPIPQDSFSFHPFGMVESAFLSTRRRIVVTGMGLVTPLGCGVNTVWERIVAGQSGIRPIALYDKREQFKSQIAGEVPEGSYQPSEYLQKNIRKMGRFIRWALVAAGEALEDAGWNPRDSMEKSVRTGVILGSGIGGLPEIEAEADRFTAGSRISPFFVPSALINLSAGHVSIAHGIRGPNISVVTACSSGSHAIGESINALRCGKADVIVTGGCEAAICPLAVGGFDAMQALSRKRNDCPEQASRPWDKDRDGFVIGEGAGVLILETLEHALARNAKIYGEILGYGLSADAFHMASPPEGGDGAFSAITMALNDAGCRPEDIGYINAHATSTPPGDLAELRAMERIFPSGTKISSTKSAIGHLLGAAGAVEAIFTLKALQNQILPPTLNLNNPESTSLHLVGPEAELVKGVHYAVSNSFGFGGTNASLVFSRFLG
jgi:3-oxoacyl-[acyl-carrier-protein] synthase II